MWRTKSKSTQSPTPASVPKAKLNRENRWYSATHTTPHEMRVYLANNFLMARGGSNNVKIDDAVLFGAVDHSDIDFERNWAELLQRAQRRIEVLNRGELFTLEEVTGIEWSVCSSCDKRFEGEDYLCPDCKNLQED